MSTIEAVISNLSHSSNTTNARSTQSAICKRARSGAAGVSAGVVDRCHLHPHWQQYDEVAYGIHATVGLVMFVMSLFSILGNLLVIIVFSK